MKLDTFSLSIATTYADITKGTFTYYVGQEKGRGVSRNPYAKVRNQGNHSPTGSFIMKCEKLKTYIAIKYGLNV